MNKKYISSSWSNLLSNASNDTVFDLIGAWGAYVNLFSTTSAKRYSSGW